jgi:hypothetical protein
MDNRLKHGQTITLVIALSPAYANGTKYGYNSKLFWCKFTHAVCQINLFIEMQQIFLKFIKWYSLQKKVSIFMVKSFVRLTPRVNLKTFWRNFCKIYHCVNETIIFPCCETSYPKILE